MGASTDIQIVELGGGRRATYEGIGEGEPALMLPGGPGLAAGICAAPPSSPRQIVHEWPS